MTKLFTTVKCAKNLNRKLRFASYLMLSLFLVGCSSNDKTLFELLPKDLDTANHIFSYLLISFVILAFVTAFSGAKRLPFFSVIYFFVIYFTHEYGFFKLFFVSLIPTFILSIIPIIWKAIGIFSKKEN